MPVTMRNYRPLKTPGQLSKSKSKTIELDNYQTSEGSMLPLLIPKIIHQTWKHANLPIQYRHYSRSWRQRNPGYQYKFYDDTECLHVVENHFPAAQL